MERSRNWCFLIYQENCPDPLSILSELCVDYVLSPLHNLDCDADGVVKKAHYHCMVLFSGNKSLKQIQEISDCFSGVLPVPVRSVRSMVRYFIHLDNKDKYQYSRDDIVSNISFNKYLVDKADADSLLVDICQFIELENIVEFNTLVSYCLSDHSVDWFPLVVKNAFFFRCFLNSRRCSKIEKISFKPYVGQHSDF